MIGRRFVLVVMAVVLLLNPAGTDVLYAGKFPRVHSVPSPPPVRPVPPPSPPANKPLGRVADDAVGAGGRGGTQNLRPLSGIGTPSGPAIGGGRGNLQVPPASGPARAFQPQSLANGARPSVAPLVQNRQANLVARGQAGKVVNSVVASPPRFFARSSGGGFRGPNRLTPIFNSAAGQIANAGESLRRANVSSLRGQARREISAAIHRNRLNSEIINTQSRSLRAAPNSPNRLATKNRNVGNAPVVKKQQLAKAQPKKLPTSGNLNPSRVSKQKVVQVKRPSVSGQKRAIAGSAPVKKQAVANIQKVSAKQKQLASKSAVRKNPRVALTRQRMNVKTTFNNRSLAKQSAVRQQFRQVSRNTSLKRRGVLADARRPTFRKQAALAKRGTRSGALKVQFAKTNPAPGNQRAVVQRTKQKLKQHFKVKSLASAEKEKLNQQAADWKRLTQKKQAEVAQLTAKQHNEAALLTVRKQAAAKGFQKRQLQVAFQAAQKRKADLAQSFRLAADKKIQQLKLKFDRSARTMLRSNEILGETRIVKNLDTSVRKATLDYVGDTHVYAIRGRNGTRKIGESAQGLRLADGKSFRAEQQVRRLTRETGDFYESEIRKTFPNKRSAREYESRLIERFRRMFGDDTLPGNKTNR